MTIGEIAIQLGFKIDKNGVNQALGAIKEIQHQASAMVRSVVGSFEAITRKVMDFAGHVVDGAAKTQAFAQGLGLTVQQVQELGFVAESSGSNMQQLSVGLGQYERQLRLLARGELGKHAKAAFAELGIHQQQAANAIRSPEGLMGSLDSLADRFHKMGDTAERGALGQQLFGARAGRSFLADISGGSARINELMARRRQMGELDQKDIDNLRELRIRWSGIGTEIQATLAKVLANRVPQLLEDLRRLSDWIGSHREEIGHAFDVLLSVLRSVFKTIARIIAFLDQHPLAAKILLALVAGAKLFSIFASLFGPIATLAMKIGSLGPLISGVGSVARGMAGAFATWLGPLALAVADIALIIHDATLAKQAIGALNAKGDDVLLEENGGDVHSIQGHIFTRDDLAAARARGLARAAQHPFASAITPPKSSHSASIGTAHGEPIHIVHEFADYALQGAVRGASKTNNTTHAPVSTTTNTIGSVYIEVHESKDGKGTADEIDKKLRHAWAATGGS